MKVVFLIPTLGAGGAERVMTHLASWMALRPIDVAVVTLSAVASDYFMVPAAVRRVGLDMMSEAASAPRAALANARRVRALRRVLRAESPDFVVSFLTEMNVLALVASVGLRCPVIVSERIDPQLHSLPRPWRGLRRLTYRLAAALVVQTESIAGWFRRSIPSVRRVEVIPNPILPPAESDDVVELPEEFLLGIGRLVPQKGFALLIDAFARIAVQYPRLHLVIAGEGPEERHLRHKAASAGVGDRVHLVGRVSVARLLRRARLFVLSSHFEGFPNVLLEAMACGTRILATDCPTGPREILAPNLTRYLVPVGDSTALSEALLRELAQSHDPCYAAYAADVVSRYAVDAVGSRWLALMDAVGGRHRVSRFPRGKRPTLIVESQEGASKVLGPSGDVE